jgi:hypothetical protein
MTQIECHILLIDMLRLLPHGHGLTQTMVCLLAGKDISTFILVLM